MTRCPVNHHATSHLVFVLLSTVWVTLSPAIYNPASCKINAVIHFLHTKNVSAVEIYCESCTVYGQNVMTEGNVRQWCRMLKDGWTYVYDKEGGDWPSVVSDKLVQSVDQKICERRRSTISEVSCEIPQISCTVLYEITTVRVGYHHKFCARWVPKMLIGEHKMQRMTWAFTLLEQYHKDCNGLLNHIIRVTGDERPRHSSSG
jgi:hypothetical protein